MDELSTSGEGRLSIDLSREEDGSPLVKLYGELDLATADELEMALKPSIHHETRRLVVDASGLEFADSSGIALLIRLANVVEDIEIRQPPRLLREVINRMGLADRLHVVP
jgi:anti-anti-sigma factor